MKQIIITIRPSKYYEVKEALSAAGFNSMSIKDVFGRGKEPVTFEANATGSGNVLANYVHPMVSKKMIEIYARDEDCDRITDIVLDTASSGTHGDGRIFILPVESVIRMRTGEKDDNAIM
ncbi:MAG: P-II family nitrogen regulator [Ruminococcus albus]|jgi:nitrogen regulatory protein PII|nr:P-II family nitrogen regulator [Ruminococcus albus]